MERMCTSCCKLMGAMFTQKGQWDLCLLIFTSDFFSFVPFFFLDLEAVVSGFYFLLLVQF